MKFFNAVALCSIFISMTLAVPIPELLPRGGDEKSPNMFGHTTTPIVGYHDRGESIKEGHLMNAAKNSLHKRGDEKPPKMFGHTTHTVVYHDHGESAKEGHLMNAAKKAVKNGAKKGSK